MEIWTLSLRIELVKWRLGQNKKCCNRLIISTLEGCPVGLEPTTFRTTI